MKYFHVDVFTDQLFSGNPAGVCLLDEWPADELLQSIAFENNLSETAFLVKLEEHYHLRWFTPLIEVDLCGHATVASASVLFEFVETEATELSFETLSGILTVTRGDDDLLWLDLPARPAASAPLFQSLTSAFNTSILEVHRSADFLVVLESEDAVKNLTPDFDELKKLREEAAITDDLFGVIVTAPGSNCDFVSRFFAPNAGIDEDPVTGRAHAVLIPYWSKRLGKTSMTARQLSERGGQLWCIDDGNRVKLGGKTKLYLTGNLHI
ncbi:MAG: PhzF family phenazine biosynthesis protein [Coriobacteriia bacterium]|nr:PhzF family phenazine biosynthesis protein [Coriobacteriia bacterium]